MLRHQKASGCLGCCAKAKADDLHTLEGKLQLLPIVALVAVTESR